MPVTSLQKTVVALLLASSALLGSVNAEPQNEHRQQHHVRSVKHSKRSRHESSSSSQLAKRGATYSGQATYYQTGLGACGGYNSPSDYIVALNEAQYGDLGQRSSWCGKSIAITYNGKTRYATVADACPTCAYGSLDMSAGLFSSFASLDQGVFQMTWTANDGSGGNNNNNNNNAWTSTSTSSSSAWTPAWTPSSTSTKPTWTSTSQDQPKTTSTTTTISSTSTRTSTSTTSTSTTTSTKSADDADPTNGTVETDNLSGFAQLYDSLHQMAVAAAS